MFVDVGFFGVEEDGSFQLGECFIILSHFIECPSIGVDDEAVMGL